MKLDFMEQIRSKVDMDGIWKLLEEYDKLKRLFE